MKINKVNKAGYLKESFHYFHLNDNAGQELDFHFHDFDKLVILISGKVDYLVESSSYQLNSWDVLLVKHHTIHKAIIDRTVPYERIIIYLDRKYFERIMPGTRLLDCFDIADSRGRHLLSAEPKELEELKEAIKAYEKCADDTRFGAQTMREAMIIQLLIHVGRLTEAEPGEIGAMLDGKIHETLSYINENFRHELSVDKLAENVYLSKYHFMRLFKAQTGSTVHNYIRQKRLMNAARLIREGVPSARAASESGFMDYSSFHRAFKTTFGISPGELKK